MPTHPIKVPLNHLLVRRNRIQEHFVEAVKVDLQGRLPDGRLPSDRQLRLAIRGKSSGKVTKLFGHAPPSRSLNEKMRLARDGESDIIVEKQAAVEVDASHQNEQRRPWLDEQLV